MMTEGSNTKCDGETAMTEVKINLAPYERGKLNQSRHFGTIALNFSRSRMFILKPPGITTSPGF